MRRWIWLLLATALIAAVVFPWGDFQGHTHWAKVAWIPFVSTPVRLRDIVANVLLFVPFGVAIRRVTGPRGVVVATVLAAALSFVGETMQLYSHTRFPSTTDLACNTAGAALGAFLARGQNAVLRGARPGTDRHSS